MRKPLGRLAVAVLASVAIPLSFIPAASAADQYNAPSVSVSAFTDNTATGVDIGGGYGMLRINSTAGEPLDLASADFEIVGTVFQASEDSRSWEAKVRFHGTKSFKKNEPSVSWHCGGGGHPTKPTRPTKTKPTTPSTTVTTPSTSDTTPSDTTTTSAKPTTSDTPTSSETPTSSATSPTDTPSTSESPSSSATTPPSDTTTAAPTSDTTPPSGGTVTCPVKPVGSSTPSGPQQVVRPVKAPETGFGGMA
ncbi:hypothetical protein [Amycolatopsis sp.]|uniref:hypothetical protein n=1 Tax=Amycolatopsis sp. TaxID=37632 RepID=UPI00260CC9B1|nr:hypothetical protein [Amycolatopsis sp.]